VGIVPTGRDPLVPQELFLVAQTNPGYFFAYVAPEVMSNMTTVSFPTTHASCPAPRSVTSPAFTPFGAVVRDPDILPEIT